MHTGRAGRGAHAGLLRPHRGQFAVGQRTQLRRGLMPRQGRDPAQAVGLQLQRVGQRRRALVQHHRDRGARDAGPARHPPDACQRHREGGAVAEIAGVEMVAQRKAVLAIQGITETGTVSLDGESLRRPRLWSIIPAFSAVAPERSRADEMAPVSSVLSGPILDWRSLTAPIAGLGARRSPETVDLVSEPSEWDADFRLNITEPLNDESTKDAGGEHNAFEFECHSLIQYTAMPIIGNVQQSRPEPAAGGVTAARR